MNKNMRFTACLVALGISFILPFAACAASEEATGTTTAASTAARTGTTTAASAAATTGTTTVSASDETSDATSKTTVPSESRKTDTILAAKYRYNEDGTQQIDWYLLCDTDGKLYITYDLKEKSHICDFPQAMSYKFGITGNGDIIAVYRSEFSKAVTTEYGPDLDTVRKNPYVLLKSENYKIPREVDFGEYHADIEEGLAPCGWLENCGFCSLPNGDVIFAEYTRMGVLYTANCWRIKAGSDLTDKDSWEIVKRFTVAENDKDYYDETAVEHFHTVQMDPFTGIVYIATGDTGNKAQMWYSKDNGDTWIQQTFLDPDSGKRVTSGEKLFRILNYNFTKDYVYWSSDSSADHAILRCKRTESGELDPAGITILAELEDTKGHPATYGTVLYQDLGIMVLMERCDSAAPSMQFRVYDLLDDEIKTIDTITAAGEEKKNIGFRTEYTEFDPPDGVIKMGFGSHRYYINRNNLLGNPGSKDWTDNINNMWIKVSRDKNGKIIADYGYYQFGRGISTEPENSGTEQQAEPEMQETTTHTDYEAYPQPKGNGPDPTNE